MKLRIPFAIIASLLISKIEINAKPTQDVNLDSSLLENNNDTDLSFDNQSFFNDEKLLKRASTGIQKISDISYVESLSEVPNPYRGFYKQTKIFLKRNGKSSSQYIESPHLLRVLVDISDYKNHSLDSAAITYLGDILKKIQSYNKSIVIRFSYHDYESKTSTREPSDINIVFGHQESIGKVLKKYQDMIASVECGLYGKWGEMHGSSVYNDKTERLSFTKKVITKWLNVLPESITLSVRTTQFYCNWNSVDRSKIANDITKPGQAAYRIGMYNDGYLGSHDDIGTYDDREKEIKWLSNQCNHALCGGEFGNYVDQKMGDVKHTAEYMYTKDAFRTHFSYLNLGHYKPTVDSLRTEKYRGTDPRYKGQYGFTYIENHLGYRFVVRGVRLTKNAYKNNKFEIEVDIENVGFAPLIKPKSLYFIIVDNYGKSNVLSDMKILKNGNPNSWLSEETYTLKAETILSSSLSNGNNKIYLRISTKGELDGLKGYPIRFANNDENIWNNKLGANYLGSFIINNSDKAPYQPPSPSPSENTTSKPPSSSNVPVTNPIYVDPNYATLKFKGMLEDSTNYYLGVPSLKEIDNFNIYELTDTESAKYRTWHVTSEKSPSLLYLSNGSYGNIGEPSGYCLDLGSYTNDNGYPYLSIVECSKAQHKFMHGGTYINSIDVYDMNGKHFKDSQGQDVCLYYSMTPRLDKCKNFDSNIKMRWNKYILDTIYTPIKFKGMMNNTDINYYLGVPELKEVESFDIHLLNDENSAKYRTWHTKSENNPSLLFLSNGIYGNIGEPTKYCLDLGRYTNDEGYNFLSIVECSKAKHKFVYGRTSENSLNVYDIYSNPSVDGNGNQLCVYYSMTPRVDRCNNPKTIEKMNWIKYVLNIVYTPIRIKGVLSNSVNHYLGAPELKEQSSFNSFESNSTEDAKYHTWFTKSESSPSLFYLSSGTDDNVGEPSHYCLDLGTYMKDDIYNYLSIVECSKVQHQFMLNGFDTNIISVYDMGGHRLNDNSGNNLCLYYSMTPRIDRCDSKSENIKWDIRIV